MLWRTRLTWLAMSVVVAWHGLAMVVAPAPNNSELVQSLRPLFEPYLLLFRLDTAWNFFAPVGKHAQFRYVIEDAAGNRLVFTPTEEPSAAIAQYVWWREFKYLDDGIMETAETRGNIAGALLCQKHAALSPRAVTLLEVQEKDFWPEDELLGKRPLDPEYITVNTLKRFECGGVLAPLQRSPIRPVRRPP